GRRYVNEKKAQGGTGANQHAAQRDQSGPSATAERLAAEYKVGKNTIKRDALFAQAVDELAKHYGEEVKPLILTRDARLPRRAVLQLAKMDQATQGSIVQQLLTGGKLPRPLQPKTTGKRLLTLPADPKELAETVLERMGPKTAEAICQA